MSACLVLEDKTVLRGISIGAPGVAYGEMIFNTAITGYQEILTDPSYAGQIITFTFPHIGNVGTNSLDNESSVVHASGMVVRHYSKVASNWRSEKTFTEFLKENRVVAISDIDTRYLTQRLRDCGVMRGCIITGVFNDETAISLADFKNQQNSDLLRSVATASSYKWQEEVLFEENEKIGLGTLVIVVDFGVKHNILRYLYGFGCQVLVVPPTISTEEIYRLKPDGIVLSNGPGDPAGLTNIIKMIRSLIVQDIPVFGICLGHQLLALALGANTVKMKFGHHGANHPVLDLKTGRVMITSQNHGFVVEESSLPPNIHITHRSLFDGTLQGFRHTQKPIYGFQGHPEGGPGPRDGNYLFQPFIHAMQRKQPYIKSQNNLVEVYDETN